MGGLGSGRRKNYWDTQRKRLVEDCLALDIAEIDIDGFLAHRTGELFWRREGTKHSTMRFRADRIDGRATLVLCFTAKLRRGPVDVCERIPLLTTHPYFGGVRWWFSCPCCGVRVRVLYIPQGGYRWECRLCHQLTYRSCREHDSRVDELRRNPELAEQVMASTDLDEMLTTGGHQQVAYLLAMKAASRGPLLIPNTERLFA